MLGREAAVVWVNLLINHFLSLGSKPLSLLKQGFLNRNLIASLAFHDPWQKN